jgi:hypothetical protein
MKKEMHQLKGNMELCLIIMKLCEIIKGLSFWSVIKLLGKNI